jgi:hypothetical protein
MLEINQLRISKTKIVQICVRTNNSIIQIRNKQLSKTEYISSKTVLVEYCVNVSEQLVAV